MKKATNTSKRTVKKGNKRKQDENRNENAEHNHDAAKDNKRFVEAEDKDPDAKEEDMDKDIERILEAINPNAPHNIARYSYSEEQFKLEATVEQTAFHYSDDGNVILIDGEEAKLQREEEEKRKIEIQRQEEERRKEKSADGNDDEELDENPKQLHNQFNYSKRATQTLNFPPKDVFVVTEPPPSMYFFATATQWDIYDSYQLSLAQSKKSQGTKKEKGNSSDPMTTEEDSKVENKSLNPEILLQSGSLGKSLKIMERMINQNTHNEILQDFKFWNDASDEFREMGSLLPLWPFSYEKAKKKQVTAVSWNPKYHDFFAVGYGSYDFTKQGPGMICCFSLKNPSHPEYIFNTDSGVMSLDFNEKHPCLLAVGLYDGTVMIFDVRQGVPIIQSNVKTGKHSDVVWQVYWQSESIAQTLNFFSVSSDGRVTNWTLSKNELQHTDIMFLKLEDTSSDSSGEASKKAGEDSSVQVDEYLDGFAGGTCIDFNKKSEHLFIVGCEEGKIHLCSKAYNSQYLQTYEGHHMSVYSVKWNYYHHNVFISASADWTVKLWDMHHKNALMTFDLGSSVGDVAWAPYSSTVFAAATDLGKVYVYDLNVNKHDSLTDQLVVKKAKLTRISFNRSDPIILVGDDKGLVQTLKLSPNLRKTTKPSEGQTKEEAEVAKLNIILDIAIKNLSN